MKVIDGIDGLFGVGLQLRLPLDAPSWRQCVARWAPRHMAPDGEGRWQCRLPGGWPGNTATLRTSVHDATSVQLQLEATLGNPGIDETLALMADALRDAGGRVEHAALSFFGDGCGAEHEGSLGAETLARLLSSKTVQFSPAFRLGTLPVLVPLGVERRDDRVWLERP